METYSGKLGLQQRVFPFYRAPFIDALAERCAGGLGFFAGDPRPGESIENGKALKSAVYTHAKNEHYFSGKFYLCRQPGLLDWLKTWQPDALIVEANPRYLSTAGAVRWLHAHSRPVIGWGLGAPAMGGVLAPLRWLRRRDVVGSFDAVVAYSQTGADEYRRLGIPADRVFVAPNAATRAPSAPPPDRSGLQQLSLLYVGRLQARKRLDLLLRVCAGLPEENRPDLTIVGDGPERERLELLAGRIYPRAEFTGTKIGPELDEYFKAANLFVLPGTGGLAVQQAMSAGLPVVVAEGDGTQSNLVRAGNGWQVIPGSEEDLARVLLEAGSDLQRLNRMGAESYRIVKEEINIERMVDVFIQAVRRAGEK